MAYTEDQITALKAIHGEEKVAELIATKSDTTPPENSDDKQPEGSKDTDSKKETIVSEDKKSSEPLKTESSEIDDNAVLAYLKAKGISATSLEELKPKEEIDPVKAAEQLEADKLSFGLKKGLFSTKEYNDYIRDNNDQKGLVYNTFHAAAKAENPDLTDEEIAEDFNETYGLNADPSSFKFKNGVKNLAIVADRLIKDKYGKILSVDGEYEKHEQGTKSHREFEARLVAEAPIYKKQVDEVFASLKKISTKFSDGSEYAAEKLDNSIEEIKTQFLTTEAISNYIKAGYTKENIHEVAYMKIVAKNLPLIAEEIANQHLLKHQAGTRGVIPGTVSQKQTSLPLTENQQKALKAVMPSYEPLQN